MSKFIRTNDVLDIVQEHLTTLIGWATADKEHAQESNAKADLADAKSRLRALNAALLNIKCAYKD